MEPTSSRPHMPGYGIGAAGAGRLLPWSWATDRLGASHEFWLATVRPDGRPHVMPVWAVWADDALWFSASPGSRKTRNLAANPHVVMTTDNPHEPVIVEGEAVPVTDPERIAAFAGWVNAKYATEYPAEFFVENATFRVSPQWAFGLDDADFTGTPTRWAFP